MTIKILYLCVFWLPQDGRTIHASKELTKFNDILSRGAQLFGCIKKGKIGFSLLTFGLPLQTERTFAKCWLEYSKRPNFLEKYLHKSPKYHQSFTNSALLYSIKGLNSEFKRARIPRKIMVLKIPSNMHTHTYTHLFCELIIVNTICLV